MDHKCKFNRLNPCLSYDISFSKILERINNNEFSDYHIWRPYNRFLDFNNFLIKNLDLHNILIHNKMYKKQLVIGSYSYNNPEYITRKGGISYFLKSLRKVNKECHIIIFCSVNDCKNNLQDFVEKYGAKLVLHNDKYQHFDDRFIHFYLFLKNNKNYDEILLVDMDDVIFQADPFEIDYGTDLYATCESHKMHGNTPPNGQRHAGNQNWPTVSNLKYLIHAESVLTKKNFSFEEGKKKYKDKYVSNTGTILGNYDNIFKYLQYYTSINNFTTKFRVIGQGLWMYYIYNICKNVKINKNTDSEILTGGHIEPDIDWVEKDDCPSLKVDNSNHLVNKNNVKYKIFHMYNRFDDSWQKPYTGKGYIVVKNILTQQEIETDIISNNIKVDYSNINLDFLGKVDIPENSIKLKIYEKESEISKKNYLSFANIQFPKLITDSLYYEKIRKRLISFGNKRFIKSRERIINEAKELEIFDECICEKENILEEEGFKKVIKDLSISGRGYYWYMWKPYIIHKHLTDLRDGEILFYCDSGMKIPNTNTTKLKFINMFNLVCDINLCPTGIATFITTGAEKERIEKQFNLLQTLKCLGVENNEDIINSQQCQAGVTMICKCKKSVEIVEKWYNYTVTNPEIFIGDYRFCKLEKMNQINCFKDHRHDQSVWSILCKLNGVTILTHDKNPMYQSHARE